MAGRQNNLAITIAHKKNRQKKQKKTHFADLFKRDTIQCKGEWRKSTNHVYQATKLTANKIGCTSNLEWPAKLERYSFTE